MRCSVTEVVPGRRESGSALSIVVAVLLAAIAFGGCGDGGDSGRVRASDGTCDGRVEGPTYITAWFHGAQGPERKTLQRQVRLFNAAQDDVTVKLVVFPDLDFTTQVEAAAAAGELPDVLDFDGPNLYSFAWSGKLRALDSCISPALRADMLPSLRRQGTYDGRMWGVGTFDSGLALYVRPSILRKAGIRIPTGIADAWSASEFTQILETLQDAGYEHPLELQYTKAANGEAPEWFTYGFAPALWSAGVDLVDRSGDGRATGTMNSPAAVKALTTVQRWRKADYLTRDPNTSSPSFRAGKTPISWLGHWVYGPFSAAHGSDLKLVPLPDFGQGSRSGMGSWQWGITTKARDGDAAWRFLEFLMTKREVLRMSRANGSIPGTRSAVAEEPAFRPGGVQRLFVEQLQGETAVPRPQTPAYPVITAAFGRAVRAIMVGADVQEQLDRAAKTVDQDIRDHRGYPPPSR